MANSSWIDFGFLLSDFGFEECLWVILCIFMYQPMAVSESTMTVSFLQLTLRLCDRFLATNVHINNSSTRLLSK
ncbi:hypothetical protein PILCRDRAFT_183829 [Piloderma croceum F 1598]|uniref:Uncharacterized protein n=1 Tax=Piloderma croceum (strain F 1598) TaxID=765440 RepID=A0A0C3GFI8_PILCF|nr:hypothetical protein PILCRDRAFT_183829 [Piloderma croceum F 1598]